MADADDVRRLALALPEVVEIDSDGFDFRVADKGFVWSYPERRPGRPRVIRTDVAVLKTDVAVLKTDVAELKTDVTELKETKPTRRGKKRRRK